MIALIFFIENCTASFRNQFINKNIRKSALKAHFQV